MIKIEGITAFVAVAEAGSVSEAARRLRLSKSVVSERLAELEKTLGAKLLHRTTRKLTLTEDGVAFLERATRIVHEVQEAASDIAERRGTLAGPVRIAAPVTFGRLHLGPALYAFLGEHPDIELIMDLDDRRVDAAADGYDAVIRHGTIQDTRLIAWKLAPSRRLLVASPDYLLRNGTPASLAELDSHRGILYTNRGNFDWRFERPEGPVIVRARSALRMNNGDMIADAAIAGLGIALLPAFIAGPPVKAGKLVEIDVGYRAQPEFIYMAHSEGRHPSVKLKAMAQHLKRAFGNPPYWDAAAQVDVDEDV
ncbi:LysR family transcriptional regulator [Rhizobium sp. BK376]|uniref:LysR family transcriptional regulator n=1 Tax=Rhizobium sp. BK376 TaxID=2512149 RepID=UPI00104A3F7F|nr:LysR family transcriptional regulator [Rhizobium sp. BK376]TCR90813.1 LysR family transcriptional regulator [Rhizobium sp. BK376]